MKKISLTLCLLAAAFPALADEGMWMVNSISEALVRRMQDEGMELSGRDIYDAEGLDISDAIVSLDFGCTGSMISGQGLLITNHHCAYSDVHALSTPEHNYLEDGYWAAFLKDEIYIPGKSAYFLQKVIDVTDEVNGLIESLKASGQPHGMRRISSIIEKKYSTSTGFEASLSSMWSGSRYYLALYRVYTDIRLVAAPPVSIAAFGGDIDNWEWPQQKCDFAIYRIYATPDGSPAPHSDTNVPWHPSKYLKISTAGYSPGSFTMVLGYPGTTDRYSSSAKIAFQQDVALPITNGIRGEQMRIMKKWMDADPDIRLKYADRFFSLSNVQENNDGLRQCCERFGVVRSKRAVERKQLRGSGNRYLKESLSRKYAASSNARRNELYYRETLVRGSRIALIASRLKNNRRIRPDMEKEYSTLDLRVEKELMDYAVRTYYGNVDSSMWGPYQKEVFRKFSDGGATDYDALCAFLWPEGYITKEDNLYKFLNDVQMRDFNQATDLAEGIPGITETNRNYTRALYNYREKKGILQYPDANSTMRLTFGTVSTFRRDGREVPWQTTSDQILAKEDTTSYDFTLKTDWRELLKGTQIPVNFITDNDITGGNSGSPVLNSRGEIIGLAFDGNKESLASDVMWVDGWCKCVCVDIRFVLWTLEHYAAMDRILEEINI